MLVKAWCIIIVSVYYFKWDLAFPLPTHCKIATGGEISFIYFIVVVSRPTREQWRKISSLTFHIPLFRNEEGCLLPHFKNNFHKNIEYNKISEYSKAICSPYWDGASCFPPSLADTVVTIPCMATYFTKRFNTNCESCSSSRKFLFKALQLMGFACRLNSFFMLKGKLEWILLTLHCQPNSYSYFAILNLTRETALTQKSENTRIEQSLSLIQI